MCAKRPLKLVYIYTYDKSQFLEWVCPTSVSISGLEFSWLDINPTILMLLAGIWFKFILGLAYSIVYAFLIILKRGGNRDFAPTMYRLGALVNNSKCSKMWTGNAGYLNKVEFTYSKIWNKFNIFNFVTDFIISKFIKIFHLISNMAW